MSALGTRVEDAAVLDLFAGSGALGLEALSRGARRATFVERSGAGMRALQDNVRRLGAEDRCTLVQADAMAFVGRLNELAFDLALADPPYDRGHAAELITRFRSIPFASELWVEHRTAETIPHVPNGRRRRYGDTTITRVRAHS